MKDIYPEIQRQGAEVLAVSFAPAPKVAAFLQRYPLPFPVVSDPEVRTYQAFGLGRTTFGEILRPRVLGRFLKLIFRGWLPWNPEEGQDPFQLGGDFLLDSQGRLVYAHPSAEPTDRPGKEELLAVLGRLQPAGERDEPAG